MKLLAILRNKFDNTRDMSGATDQDIGNFTDIRLVDLGIADDLLNDLLTGSRVLRKRF